MDGQAEELRRLRGEPGLKPAERDRVEMVALSAAGWPVARIADHLGYCAETVRRLFRRWPAEGWAAVRHGSPGPDPDEARRAEVGAALRGLLAQERTWTAGQLAEALVERGVSLSARQVRRHLLGIGSGWRRTRRTLAHKQDPEAVAAAEATLGRLANARKRAS
jgi:transposase